MNKSAPKRTEVLKLLKRGTTITAIQRKLDVSQSAAQSLINDVKRAGVSVRRDKVKGVSKYSSVS